MQGREVSHTLDRINHSVIDQRWFRKVRPAVDRTMTNGFDAIRGHEAKRFKPFENAPGGQFMIRDLSGFLSTSPILRNKFDLAPAANPIDKAMPHSPLQSQRSVFIHVDNLKL